VIVTVDRIEPARRGELLTLLATAWWAAHRSAASLDRMLDHSDAVVGLVDTSSDRLVGFARAITDRTFLAVVMDVVVDPTYRGQGLGERLVDDLLARPELSGVDSVELVCQPELVPFYRRLGFTDDVGRSLLMRRTENTLLAPRA